MANMLMTPTALAACGGWNHGKAKGGRFACTCHSAPLAVPMRRRAKRAERQAWQREAREALAR